MNSFRIALPEAVRIVRRPACFFLLLAIIVFSSDSLPAVAAESGTGLPETESCTADCGDSIWLVDTRHLKSISCSLPLDCLQFSHRDEGGCWHCCTADNIEEAAQPDIPCIVFIHGNLTDKSWAVIDAYNVLHALRRDYQGPVQLVIWSWPSEVMIPMAVVDTQIKATRADNEGFLLAMLTEKLNRKAPVTLVGYSFGARTTCSAIELLAGGSVNCCSLGYQCSDQQNTAETSSENLHVAVDDASACSHLPLNLVMIGPAINSDVFMRGGRYSRVPHYADSVLTTKNHLDKVLRFYPMMYRRIRTPAAMGYTGPVVSPESLDRITVLNMTNAVGRDHDLADYLKSCALVSQITDRILSSEATVQEVAELPEFKFAEMAPHEIDDDAEPVMIEPSEYEAVSLPMMPQPL